MAKIVGDLVVEGNLTVTQAIKSKTANTTTGGGATKVVPFWGYLDEACTKKAQFVLNFSEGRFTGVIINPYD